MKSTQHSNKSGSSNQKSKKSSKDREKRKSQSSTGEINNHNATEKITSPTKDSSCSRLYAGIDAESVNIYIEQNTVEHLSQEVTNFLTEDINYRLRYIINDSLIKARLSGRNIIHSNDIENTFTNLNLDRVYGAPAHPHWVPFGYPNLFYLDDDQVNLVEIAEEETVHTQFLEPILRHKWIPEEKEISKALKKYFSTMCQAIVSKDYELRRMSLKNISNNPRIGSIIEWFYNFGYILLSRDITYDCLTLRALKLIKTLEMSPTCRINVSEKKLKLIIRLMLQRLLKSAITPELLPPMCSVLAILCFRKPLKDFVILKISQKMDEIFEDYSLAILRIICSLGLEAIVAVFCQNIDIFFKVLIEKEEPAYIYLILEVFHVLNHENMISPTLYGIYLNYFGNNGTLIVFEKAVPITIAENIKKDTNFAQVKYKLLKTRRKLKNTVSKKSEKISIEDVFEMPSATSKVRKKITDHKFVKNPNLIETHIIVGKTSLLLPVFQPKKQKSISRCYNHTLCNYNL